MNIQSFFRGILPLCVRKFIFARYADAILDDAIALANEKHNQDGHRYYVLPTKSGNLKVTNADTETRDPARLRDKRLLKRSVRKPYQLRKEAFYFTASRYCAKRYVPDAMQDWELKAIRESKYYDWFFSRK